MIRVVMLGRLGNNLFQYALGRVLAEKHGVPLVMDASWFNAEGWGQVKCLKDLPGPAAGTVKVVRRCSLGARTLLKATGKHHWEYRGVPVLKEKTADHSFDPRFLAAPADCLLFGYFQTPLYFAGMESALREELSTHGLGLEKGREDLADRLRERGSVAVHVRRTDYTANPQLNHCGVTYYQNAMARLRADGAKRFFVFSDDPLSCSDEFADPDVEVVTHEGNQSPLTDLHFMSLANHQIIANSSYSWWAAWLGEKPGQRVILPDLWFGGIASPVEEKRLPNWETATCRKTE
jgi:hypothetical protein